MSLVEIDQKHIFLANLTPIFIFHSLSALEYGKFATNSYYQEDYHNHTNWQSYYQMLHIVRRTIIINWNIVTLLASPCWSFWKSPLWTVFCGYTFFSWGIWNSISTIFTGRNARGTLICGIWIFAVIARSCTCKLDRIMVNLTIRCWQTTHTNCSFPFTPLTRWCAIWNKCYPWLFDWNL